LKDLGAVGFNSDSIKFVSDNESRSKVVQTLTKRECFWEPKAGTLSQDKAKHFLPYNEIFGFDPNLADQRFNYLYFQLLRPIYLTANSNGRCVANGRIFLHFFPSGYLQMILAVTLHERVRVCEAALREALIELQPWRSDSRWIWSGRIGEGSLRSLIEYTQKKVFESLYVDPRTSPRTYFWSSAVKLRSRFQVESFIPELLREGYSIMRLAYYPRCDLEMCYFKKKPLSYVEERLLISRRGISCVLSPDRPKNWSIHFFWRLMDVYFFVLLKRQIYDDYAHLMRREILRLQELRLQSYAKLTKENVLRLSVYDPEIPKYMLALDSYVKSLPPFYRKIYSELSEGLGFDKKRQRLKELVKDWQEEVGQWQPTLVWLLNKILKPLKSLLM